MNIKNIIILFLILFFSLSLSAQKELEWLNGTWTGKGYQVDDQTWSIEFKYDNERGVSYIQYPSMNCHGQWKYVKKDDCVYIFLEKISHGECDNDIHVYVTRIDNDHLSVAYFLPNVMEGVVAYSVLTRKK
jgi:hypothetical protein